MGLAVPLLPSVMDSFSAACAPTNSSASLDGFNTALHRKYLIFNSNIPIA